MHELVHAHPTTVEMLRSDPIFADNFVVTNQRFDLRYRIGTEFLPIHFKKPLVGSVANRHILIIA
jgi:hypothetical protein